MPYAAIFTRIKIDMIIDSFLIFDFVFGCKKKMEWSSSSQQHIEQLRNANNKAEIISCLQQIGTFLQSGGTLVLSQQVE